jgi:hypothetical protein
VYDSDFTQFFEKVLHDSEEKVMRIRTSFSTINIVQDWNEVLVIKKLSRIGDWQGNDYCYNLL